MKENPGFGKWLWPILIFLLLITMLGTASDIETSVRAAIPRLESTEIIPFDA